MATDTSAFLFPSMNRYQRQIDIGLLAALDASCELNAAKVLDVDHHRWRAPYKV